jgi:hypothetical protein
VVRPQPVGLPTGSSLDILVNRIAVSSDWRLVRPLNSHSVTPALAGNDGRSSQREEGVPIAKSGGMRFRRDGIRDH